MNYGKEISSSRIIDRFPRLKNRIMKVFQYKVLKVFASLEGKNPWDLIQIHSTLPRC